MLKTLESEDREEITTALPGQVWGYRESARCRIIRGCCLVSVSYSFSDPCPLSSLPKALISIFQAVWLRGGDFFVGT